MSTEVITAISTVGFPIFACCAMGWFCKYILDNIKTSIDDNTKILTKLYERLLDNDEEVKKK